MRAAPILRTAFAVSATLSLSVADSYADTITVTDQTQFDAAVATATQPGRDDTIVVNAQAISSGPSLMLPGQATALTINFNGAGAGADNPTFNVGFGDTGSLGIAAGTTLTFDTSNSTARLNVGRIDGVVAGTGTVNMTGGTIQAGPAAAGNYFALDLGRGAGSEGTFNQSGGSFFLSGGAFQVGVVGGTGTYTMSNDALVDIGALSTVYLGEGAGGNGTLNVHDSAQFLGGSGGDIYIGHNGGTGTVNQDGAGSSVVLNSQTRLGGGRSGEPGGTGTYNLSNGTLEIGALFHMGLDAASEATFNQTGGTVVLNSQMRFGAGTGTYNLTGGTLKINTANPFATGAGSYAFNLGGGTIAFTTVPTVGATLDFTLLEDTASTLDVASGTTATLSGVISGDGSLVKDGTGVLVFNAANTYTGSTWVKAGTLELGALGLAGSGALQVDAGATFNIGDHDQVVSSLAGAGTINVGTQGDLMIDGDASTAFSGTINLGSVSWASPFGTFTKSGAGTLTIDGATIKGGEAYVLEGGLAQTSGTTAIDYLSVGVTTGNTGGLTVSGGTLNIGVGLQVGDWGGTGTVTQTGGTVRIDPTCGENKCASLNIGNQGGNGTYNISSGTLELIGGTHNIGRSQGSQPASHGELNISGDALVELKPALAGSPYGNGVFIIGSRDTTSDVGGQGTGEINQSGGTFRIANGSQLFLSGYGEGTYNLNGGVLEIGGNSLRGNYTGGAAYEFNLGGGTVRAYGSDLTTSVAATFVADTISTFDTTDYDIRWNGVLSGDGTLQKVGEHVLVLNGANTYTGGTLLDGGTTVAGNDDAFGAGEVKFQSNSTLQFGGNHTLANNVSIGSGIVGDVDTDGNTGTLNGVIEGDGKLRKTGLGTLVLNAENTYTGGTQVSGGTLQLGPSGSLASTGALQVDEDGIFDLNDNHQSVGAFSGAGIVDLGIGKLTTDSSLDTTFSGVIEGVGGSFEKDGSGTLTLTGHSTYTGDTTVGQGKLVVNGSLASAVTVEADAVLGGNGSIGALDVLGTVAPGNSIGKLSVDHDAHFATGSVYEVELNPSKSDLIDVAGVVTIDGGTVRVLAQSGSYAPAKTYTIISSDGGRTGEFDDVTSNLAFLKPVLDYDADNVYLNLVRNGRDMASVATTRNQRAVASALDNLPSNSPLLFDVLGQTEAGAQQAFDALSGELHASVASTLVMNSFYVRDAIFSRLIQASYAGGGAGAQTVALAAGGPTTVALADPGTRMSLGAGFDDFGTPGSAAGSGHGLTFWTRGFGAWGDLDGDGNAAGLDRSLGGFVSGVDAGLGNGWRAGLATGYMRSDLSVGPRLSSADIDSYILAGYAGGPAGSFAIRSGAAWTWNSVDSARNVVFPGFSENERASYDPGTGQLFAEIAHPLVSASGVVEPFAGLSYVHLSGDDFTESGAVAGLSSSGADQNVGISLLGLRAGTSVPVHGVMVTPHGSVAWQYAFGDVRPAQAFAFAASGVGFGIAGVPIAQSSALIEAGIDVGIVDNLDFGIAYTGQLADQMQDNSVQGRFNWRF